MMRFGTWSIKSLFVDVEAASNPRGVFLDRAQQSISGLDPRRQPLDVAGAKAPSVHPGAGRLETIERAATPS